MRKSQPIFFGVEARKVLTGDLGSRIALDPVITVLSITRNRFHASLMAILCPAPMTQNRDPDYWRAQAAEARAAAANMIDPKSKRTLERIATSYEMLARKAEELKETARYLQKRGNKSS